MNTSLDDDPWQKLYQNVRPPLLNPLVVGFNVVLDRIIPVTPALLKSSLLNQPGLSELRSRLLHSMHTCTAEEWFVTDRELYEQYTRIFADTGNLAIGGQAGIAAIHLASIGVPDVLCIAHSVGPDTGTILRNAGVHVLDINDRCGNSSDTTHLVFEYPPGLVPAADGVVPRNNRFIASPAHKPESALIPENSRDMFMTGIFPYTRAFLSGFQYLQTEEEFALAAEQILLMKKNASRMRIHVESVSVTDDAVIGGFILPVADSIGLNEHELLLLLHNLHPDDDEYGILGVLSPVQLVKGAIEVSRICDLKRLHLHTFGYYVLVLRKDCAHPAVSLNALLFASLAAAQATKGTCTDISPVGICALEQIDDAFGPQLSPGIFLIDRYAIIIIPTIIAQNITKSSGLGDILSSTAFIADQF
jgi:ADP-dependent phosphofructokinase/glucokinase